MNFLYLGLDHYFLIFEFSIGILAISANSLQHFESCSDNVSQTSLETLLPFVFFSTKMNKSYIAIGRNPMFAIGSNNYVRQVLSSRH